jgi:uncharacterized protein YodC (DUF2158 family)
MKLKVSDVVELKTGGPTMVVANIFNNSSPVTVSCQWFDRDDHLNSGIFVPDVLVVTGK